jgi:hypothetical protein
MLFYVDFEGWATVEADTKDEALEKFYADDIIDITYGRLESGECSAD